jgi:hypothetical protein
MKINRTELLTRMVRRSGITKQELANRMGISITTLRKYMSSPDKMTGIMRKKMASTLGTVVTTIDDIANKQAFNADKAQIIIESLKTKTKHGNSAGDLDSD